MNRSVALILTSVLLSSISLAGTPYVAVPDTTWAELSPYIEANIRVSFVDGELRVGASSESFERKLFEPYDPLLGEFATVLLVEGLREAKTHKLVQQAADSMLASGIDVSSLTRDELASLYWQELTKQDQFMTRLEKLYQQVQAKGRLECLICDEGFEPQHLELL